LLGYAELQFILAEAMLKGWISGDVKKSYTNGISASFKFYENYAKNPKEFMSDIKLNTYVDAIQLERYLSQEMVNLDQAKTPNEKLERILMQKYLRSFHQGGYTAYFDHLRTGYPSLRKAENVKVAYRWMYPQDEYNNNTEQVAAAIKNQFAGNDNINLQTWWLK
jgi:hypothetical protein